jgi:small-conductance mechanosensitive channel
MIFAINIKQLLHIDFNHWIERALYYNSVKEYIFWAVFIILGTTAVRLSRAFLKSRFSKSKTGIAGKYLKTEKYLYPLGYLLLYYVVWHALDKPESVSNAGRVIFTIAFVLLITRLVAAILSLIIYGYLTHQEMGTQKVKQLRGIVLIINGALWILGLVILFDNLGFNVTAILTGLGVGGIAIALAAQTILGDIFNYFVIFFDRPFEVGDFIIVDDKMGVVEYIGLKTTRLRSLSGEQLVFSNTNLTSSRLHNYKRMEERRVVFKFGVIYNTGYDNLSQIPSIVKSIVTAQGKVKFDRAHLASFGDYSIDYEVVYYVMSSDYNTYMDIQQSINLELYKRFQAAHIEFAFPTQTVLMKGNLMNGKTGMNFVFNDQ